MSDETNIILNNNNGVYKDRLVKEYNYETTMYDDFDKEIILGMLFFIYELSLEKNEIFSTDNDILTKLNKIANSNRVSQKHLEQLLKLLEWHNVVSNLWHSKNHDAGEEAKAELLNLISNTPEENKVYLEDLKGIDIEKI